jgi:hypothetical protein
MDRPNHGLNLANQHLDLPQRCNDFLSITLDWNAGQATGYRVRHGMET